MAKAPAVIIIVRHGARLDAADQSWHLTSPTPYDPPLTYGGFIQSRALGLRIASLLNAREQEEGEIPADSPRSESGRFPTLDETNIDTKAKTKNAESKSKKKKHRVFIHTSPFQRCVQTSIGISAGLSQYQALPAVARKGSDARIKAVNQLHSSSPRLNAIDSPRLESIPEPPHMTIETKELALRQAKEQPPQPEKATLRVDAFLGEWLSPGYFDHITPPPNSTMMLAGTKSYLQEKAEDLHTYTPTISKATGMWGTPPLGAAQSASSHHRHNRDRANSSGSTVSHSSRVNSGRSRSPFSSSTDPLLKQGNAGYVPPVPTYAVSSTDPIPRGYVGHAKDACVNIDHHWDSMRAPHYWGDGGTYGEEWSDMHKRFRRGLNSMIQCYSHENGTKKKTEDGQKEEEDEDVDEVLVLVTHGAGCNALIGAFTNQPVLIDVGMASLTMAVRNSDGQYSVPPSSVTSPYAEDTDPLGQRRPPIRRNSVDFGLSNIYNLKIVASADHLRPGVDPAKHSKAAPSSPMLASQTVPDSRRRLATTAQTSAGVAPDSNWNIGEPASGRSASTIGPSGIRRGSVASAKPERMRTYSLAAAVQVNSALEEMKANTSSPSGLWSSPIADKPPSPVQEFTLDSSNSNNSSRSASRHSSRPSSRSGRGVANGTSSEEISPSQTPGPKTPPIDENPAAEEAAEVALESESAISDLPIVGAAPPSSLNRSLSQKGLWGSAPSGIVSRETSIPKRRWTLQQRGN